MDCRDTINMTYKGLLECQSTLELQEDTMENALLSEKVRNNASINLIDPGADFLLEETLNSVLPQQKLTNREAQILRLIIEGNTNKKIAEKLYRTERTVEYHRNRLMKKLGARSVVDLVKRSIAMGLL